MSTSSFVWAPGGSSHAPNVYSSWSVLYSALSPLIADGVHYDLAVDTRSGPAEVPAGAWPLGAGRWGGASMPTIVKFARGARIDGTRIWTLDSEISVQTAEDATEPTWTIATGAALLLMRSADLSSLSRSVPFVRVLDSALGLNAQLSLATVAAWGPGTDGAAAISCEAGASALVFAAAQSALFNGALGGPGAGVLYASADDFLASGAVAGGWNLLRETAAELVAYAPASSPDWNGVPPLTIAAALDRIAAKLGPVP